MKTMTFKTGDERRKVPVKSCSRVNTYAMLVNGKYTITALPTDSPDDLQYSIMYVDILFNNLDQPILPEEDVVVNVHEALFEITEREVPIPESLKNLRQVLVTALDVPRGHSMGSLVVLDPCVLYLRCMSQVRSL